MENKSIQIMKHALGISNGGKEYRNYYVTGPGSDDYEYCEALFARGFMVRHPNHLNEMNVEYIYIVTEEGKRAIVSYDRACKIKGI